MFAEERRSKILEILEKSQRIEVSDLVEILGVSESTIRRDLQDLEQSGLLKRTHGGAVKAENTSSEPTMDEKELDHLEEKKEIGEIAASLINDKDTILLDSGTTTLQIAKSIKAQGVIVLTNSILIALELAKNKEAEVILTGGELRKETMSIVGSSADEFIQGLRVDKAFIGTNGISLKEGCTTPNLKEANTKKQMIQVAKAVYIVADRSKFGKISFAQFMKPQKIEQIITDHLISPELIAQYESHNIKLISSLGGEI